MSGCVTPPPAAPPYPMPAAPETAVRGTTCSTCEEQTREIARLRQDLAIRDAELLDLRSNQRNQVKVLQDSTREATRAKVRLRRLATQADAASYIAEVEVALASLRSSLAPTTSVPLLDAAHSILAATAVPFAQGDYGGAMDGAVQAEQLIALVADDQARRVSRRRVPTEVLFQMPISLKVTTDSALRRKPSGEAPVVGVLKKETRLVVYAYKGYWMRASTEEGRSGWVRQTQLGAR